MKFESSIVSGNGSRTDNQDVCRVFASENHGHYYILADGLGGHQGGDAAAGIAVSALYSRLRNGAIARNMFSGLIADINNEILQAQTQASRLHSMRTTLVLLHLDNDSAYWLHCGDSRLYHFRENRILSVTKDHTVAQMLVSNGELSAAELRSHPDRHKLLRSLGGTGSESNVRELSEPIKLQPGDSFLLCTDGWWEQLADSMIVECLADDPSEWLENMQREINRNTTPITDNYTAIAVTV